MGKKFVLITTCSALTRLFKSQTVSLKLLRWMLRLMEYDMELRWRPPANHQLPDTLSRLPIEDTQGVDVDDSFQPTPPPGPRVDIRGGQCLTACCSAS